MEHYGHSLLSKGYIEFKDQRVSLDPVSLSLSEANALSRFIKDNDILKVVEVGLGWGVSSIFIANAIRENEERLKKKGCLYIFDPYQEESYNNLGLKNIEKAGVLDIVTFESVESSVGLAALLDSSGEEAYDLCFIDGYHTFDQALVDFCFSDKLIKLNGFIVFHDMWMSSLRKIVSFIKRNKKYIDLRLVSYSQETWRRKLSRCLLKLINQPKFWDYSGYFFGPENMCFLKKIENDDRNHRSFKNF